MSYRETYNFWLEDDYFDQNTKNELLAIRNNEEEIEDRFYRDLEFGTGGLRGVIGAGTNRMNIYTVAKASQGLADYLKKHFKEPSVAIGYDSRIKSDVFAKTAAEVLAANGLTDRILRLSVGIENVNDLTADLTQAFVAL